MKKREQHLTSVKLEKNIWNELQVNCTKYKTSFQKISERSAYLYNNDPEFRTLINNTLIKYNH